MAITYLKKANPPVQAIDTATAETVRKMAPEALMIFITTESEAELVHRLETRKTETADSLAIRIATARKELQRIAAFEIGELRPAAEGIRQSFGGAVIPLVYPAHDPFWPAVEQGLSASGRKGDLTA